MSGARSPPPRRPDGRGGTPPPVPGGHSRPPCSASDGFVSVRDLVIHGAEAIVGPFTPRPSDRETQVLRRHALYVLRRVGADLERAAVALGVCPLGLHQKMKRYRIGPHDFRP